MCLWVSIVVFAATACWATDAHCQSDVQRDTVGISQPERSRRAIDRERRQPRLVRISHASRLLLVPPVSEEVDDGRSVLEMADVEYLPSPSDRVPDELPPPPPNRGSAGDDPEYRTPNFRAQGPVAGGTTRVSTRPWLDIRPRTLARDNAVRIGKDDLPEDISGMPEGAGVPRMVQLYEFNLQPIDFCSSSTFLHPPLYFEDRCLERCGATPGLLGCVPPIRSGVHFMASTALLPIAVLRQPPHQCVRSACLCPCR